MNLALEEMDGRESLLYVAERPNQRGCNRGRLPLGVASSAEDVGMLSSWGMGDVGFVVADHLAIIGMLSPLCV